MSLVVKDEAQEPLSPFVIKHEFYTNTSVFLPVAKKCSRKLCSVENQARLCTMWMTK